MRKGTKRRKNTMRRRNTNRKVRRNTKYTKRKNTRRNFRWMGGMTPRAGTPKRLRPSTPQGTPPAEPAVGQRPPAPKNLPEDTLRELVEVINNQHMRWHYYANLDNKFAKEKYEKKDRLYGPMLGAREDSTLGSKESLVIQCVLGFSFPNSTPRISSFGKFKPNQQIIV